MSQCYPQVPSERLPEVIVKAKDAAFAHGLVFRQATHPGDPDTTRHAPFVLVPSVVPERAYTHARKVQAHYDLLVHRLAHDHAFLQQALASTIEVDDFTRRLWGIYDTVRREGPAQPYSLGLNRCDYMFHCDPAGCENCVTKTSLKLIEINTIACSFGGLSQQLTQLHRYIMNITDQQEKLKQMPDNHAADCLGAAMFKAWQLYNNPKAVIVFLVTDPEQNMYDQRWMEYAVDRAGSYRARVIRCTLNDLSTRANLQEDRRLVIDGLEVAIVYKRAGYVPGHLTEQDWATQLMVERSRAIKCPSAAYQLVGTKKVQQVLAKPGVLEQYISEPTVLKDIRDTFVGQYSLDLDEEGDRNAAMAMSDPRKFVLKPQREGGGNNFFGDEVRTKLQTLQGIQERSAYVLMERIWPVTVHNYPVRVGHAVERHEMVSELGVFGTLIGTADEVLYSQHDGHILRTKTLGTDEGGVAMGFSCLDSPLLVADQSDAA